MANEASIINNPDSTPGAVSTGYQLQNTGFIAQRNGVDCTVVEALGTNQVKVKISGPVDVNGVLYEIDTEATLTISATGTYVVYLAGSGNNLTPTLLNTTTSYGTWDDSKNARYYSSQRVLNWVIYCALGSTPTVCKWLDVKTDLFLGVLKAPVAELTGSKTENEIFDFLDPYIPNTNNEINVGGALGVSTAQILHPRKAIRVSSTRITISGLLHTFSSDNLSDGGYGMDNGGTDNYTVSIRI